MCDALFEIVRLQAGLHQAVAFGKCLDQVLERPCPEPAPTVSQQLGDLVATVSRVGCRARTVANARRLKLMLATRLDMSTCSSSFIAIRRGR
jgi:hypothetical protein